MRRRRLKTRKPTSSGSPAWMATYADLVTLLLAFFVMLLAMANFEDTRRVEAVLSSIRDAFGIHGSDVELLMTSDEPQFTPENRKQATLEPVLMRMRDDLAEHVDAKFQVLPEQREIRLSLNEVAFFAHGSDRLHPASLGPIADVAEALSGLEVDVRVEGFADATGNVEANWGLSSRRALAVVHALRSKGDLASSRLRAVARGPIPEDVVDGGDADWSRRVDIVLVGDDLVWNKAVEQLSHL